jgi:hypothetical protein
VVTVLSETPAPKIRSLALVVVTAPLLNAVDDPFAEFVTSTGLIRLMPVYSWA